MKDQKCERLMGTLEDVDAIGVLWKREDGTVQHQMLNFFRHGEPSVELDDLLDAFEKPQEYLGVQLYVAFNFEILTFLCEGS